MKKNKKAISSLEINAVYQSSAYGTDKLLHAMLRYLILLTAVIGMGVSCGGMLGLKLDFLTVVLASAYTFTTFYLLFKSLRGMLVAIPFGAVGLFVASKTLDLSVKNLFKGGFNGIFNAILDIIKRRGYETVPYLDKGIVTDFGILVLITLLAAITVGISCRKRTRVIPYAVVVAVPTMIFMFTDGVVELQYFALSLAAACAMATMGLAEKGIKGVFRSSFIGFTSFILASLLMLTPIVNTDKAMDPVSFKGINGIIGVLTPDVPVNNVQRSSSPRRQIFTGKKIMTVYTNSASTLYFKSWAGGTYGNDSWYSVDYDYGYSYAEFARGNDYFDLTQKFIESAKALGYGREELGFGLTDVSIVLAAKQKNLPLPSMSGRISSIYEDGETKYVTHIYDGVSTLESMWKGKITTKAAVFDYDRPEFSKVVYGFFEYLVGYSAHDRYPSSGIGRSFANKFYKYGNDEYIKLTSSLTSFGKSAYGQKVDDEAIDRAVEEIFKTTDIEEYYDSDDIFSTDNVVIYDGERYVLSHYGMAHAKEVAKIVSDYLADGRRYSLNPKSTGKSVTEEFLFGSKQGYCVQFATVGTLIMRKLGFYARYAEGYIAQDFKTSGGDYEYESKVTDKEGHAWCEVWIDGFGWLTVEMTPGFGESEAIGTDKPPVTTPPETSNTPITTTPPVTETTPPETTEKPPVTTPFETTEPIVDTTEPERGGGGRRFDATPIIVTAVILIPIAAIVSTVISGANKKKKRLDALIKCALSENHNSEERRILAESLKTALSGALGAYGMLPNAGELPEGYAIRLEEKLRLEGLEIPLSLCVSALVKQVYGFGMDENDIKISAYTLRALRTNARKRIGVFKLIIYRIKGVL